MKGCEKMIINNSMVTESLSSTIITECELHDVIEEGYKGEIELLRAIIAAEPSPVTESGMSVVVEGALGNFFSKLIGMIKKLFDKVISFLSSFTKSFSKLTNDPSSVSARRNDTKNELETGVEAWIYENLMPGKCESVVRNIDKVMVNLTTAIRTTRDGVGMLFEKVKEGFVDGVERLLTNRDTSEPPVLELDAGIIRGIKNIICDGFNTDIESDGRVFKCILGDNSSPMVVTREHFKLIAQTSGACEKYTKKMNIKMCGEIARSARERIIGKINEFEAYIDRVEARFNGKRVQYVDFRDNNLPSLNADHLDTRAETRAYQDWIRWAKSASYEFYSITSDIFSIICKGFNDITKATSHIRHLAFGLNNDFNTSGNYRDAIDNGTYDEYMRMSRVIQGKD
jgi:hypothetical protein